MIRKWLLFLDNLVNRRAVPSGFNASSPAVATLNDAVPAKSPGNDYLPADVEAIAARDQRHAAAVARLSDPGRADWPPVYPDPFPGLSGAVPEINAADLTVEMVGGAVAHHGVLLIRGLFNAEQVAEARAVQDRVKAASLLDPPAASGWYAPFVGKSKNEQALRRRMESRGGNWLVDSPLGLTKVMQLLEAVGVVGIIQEHFQERPAISLQKSTLRTVQPEVLNTGWHQDGSFLSEDVRSMNVWVALSHCGGSFPASGIELIPRRFEEIVPTDHSLGIEVISPAVMEGITQKYPPVIPEFGPGDALMFDEHMLHRTSLLPGVSKVRYALECWFFAPSHNSANYVPFLV